MFLASSAVVVVSIARSKASGQSLEFARSGAIVVIIGLISLLIGLHEAYQHRKMWRELIDTSRTRLAEQLEKFTSIAVGDAQEYSIRASIAITVIGTIIWAYGDQFLACGAFKFFSIPDKSGVACFSSSLPQSSSSTTPTSPPSAPLPHSNDPPSHASGTYSVDFSLEGFQLTQQDNNVLDAVAKYAAQNPTSLIQITGYADKSGSAANNIAISATRAVTVRNALVSRGIPPQDISVSFLGANDLLVQAKGGLQDKASSRRVEIAVN